MGRVHGGNQHFTDRDRAGSRVQTRCLDSAGPSPAGQASPTLPGCVLLMISSRT